MKSRLFFTLCVIIFSFQYLPGMKQSLNKSKMAEPAKCILSSREIAEKLDEMNEDPDTDIISLSWKDWVCDETFDKILIELKKRFPNLNKIGMFGCKVDFEKIIQVSEENQWYISYGKLGKIWYLTRLGRVTVLTQTGYILDANGLHF